MSRSSACPMIDTSVSRSKKMVEVVDKAIIPHSHLLQEFQCFSVRSLDFVISLNMPRIPSKTDSFSLSHSSISLLVFEDVIPRFLSFPSNRDTLKEQDYKRMYHDAICLQLLATTFYNFDA